MKKLLCLTLAFMIFFTGCSVKTVKKYGETSFNEKIDAFMMKKDDKSFIIIGEKYHYIFEPNEQFEYLLKNMQEPYKFDIENGYYSIWRDKITAKFSININKKNASNEFMDWALKNGAKQYGKKEINQLKLGLTMEGKIYLPNEEFNKTIPKLEQEYNIRVYSKGMIDTKIIESPLIDAAKEVIVIPVAIFVIAYIAVGMSFGDGTER
jgi:hypothetical protein